MTINDIREMTDDFINAADVAEVLGCGPQTIRHQAQTDASKLGFPVIVIGTRVRIPREAFIRFLDGENT